MNWWRSLHGAEPAHEFREYYAAGCGHCQNLDPAWKTAAREYEGPVTFRQVECLDSSWKPVAENARLCQNVQAFPTMKLFSGNTEVAEYTGDRTAKSLLDFAQQHDATLRHQVVPLPLVALPPCCVPAKRRNLHVGDFL
uniref:Thioredoxin domain-containing protein n=1 Tax=Noctiluca scintillans TaxID=2966 RepID=A0A7S0ZNK0_NOCSC|mmetsp:Transcript_12445/g.34269  ORF Transcript_12445/g.34269 Transcript_12445/m.34269 type:complete len:139 (+) Transcript_12445:49-465(+)